MPPDPYHHGDLKTAILDAAEELLAERPIEMVSMRELARKAGVSAGAPYHHFKDRSGLILAMCQRGFTRLGKTLTDSQSENGLDGLIQGYLEFSQTHSALYQLMFSPEATMGSNSTELHPFARPVANTLAHEMKVGREGELSRDEELVLASVWCFMHGLSSLGRAAPLQARLGDTSMFDFAKQTIAKLLKDVSQT